MVTFSPDGRYLLSGDSVGTICLWEVETGRELRRYRVPEKAENKPWFTNESKERSRSSGSISSLQFSQDGSDFLVSHGAGVHRYRARTGELLTTYGGASAQARAFFALEGEQVIAYPFVYETENAGFDLLPDQDPRYPRRLQVSGDGKRYQYFEDVLRDCQDHAVLAPAAGELNVLSYDGTHGLRTPFGTGAAAALVDLDTGTVVRSFPKSGEDKAPTSAAITQQNDRVFCNHSLWRVSDGEKLWTFDQDSYRAVAFSPAGDRLAFLVGTGVLLVEADTGEIVRELSNHTDRVGSTPVFSDDGRRVGFMTSDSRLLVWNLEQGSREIRTGPHDRERLLSFAFSRRGDRLATLTKEKRLRVWSVPDGELLSKQDVAITGDDKLCALSSSGDSALFFVESACALFSTKTGELLWSNFQPHKVHGVGEFLEDESLVRIRMEGYATDFKTATGEWLRDTPIGDLAVDDFFFPHPPPIIDGTRQGFHGLRDPSGKNRVRLVSFRDGSWCVIDDEGRFDSSNSGNIDGLHWSTGTETFSLAQLKTVYYEPDLLAKALGYSDEGMRDVARFAGAAIDLPPSLEFSRRPTQEDPTLEFTVSDRGGGIGRVAVFLNQKEVLQDARTEAQRLSPGPLRFTIDLTEFSAYEAGQAHSIEVVPYNAQNYIAGRGDLGSGMQPTKARDANVPELWAVVAGVSDYLGGSLRLGLASQDAESFGRALRLAATGLHGSNDKVHVAVLNDNPARLAPDLDLDNPQMAPERLVGDKSLTDATRENLIRELAKLKHKDVSSIDTVVVYLAGHGISWGGSDGDYHFLLKEAESGDLSVPANRTQWSISSTELSQIFKDSRAKKQVLILDTCQAGKLILDLTKKRKISSSQEKALSRLRDQTGTFILAGSAADGPSYEASKYGQGLLTYSLLMGMKTGVDDVMKEGYLDIAGLLRFAQGQVPKLAENIGGIQRPQFAMPEGGQSFALGRLAAADKELIELASPRPLMLRARFDRVERPIDDLDLSLRFNETLQEHSSDQKQASFVFLDTDRGSGALRIAGRYEVMGGQMVVHMYLFQDAELLGSSFTVKAPENDWDGLTQGMLDAVFLHLP